MGGRLERDINENKKKNSFVHCSLAAAAQSEKDVTANPNREAFITGKKSPSDLAIILAEEERVQKGLKKGREKTR